METESPHGNSAAAPEREEEATGCLLAAHDVMLERTELDGEALQAWFGFEQAAFRCGVDPDLSREGLAAAAEAVGCGTPSCTKGCQASRLAAEAA